ncbi:MAG: 2-oxoacid:acceptor oxidoreductase family protein [Beijerinckiaceae bacterium]
MNAPATIAAPQPAAMTTGATRNIMIVGVGGQGVIMISKVMALLGQNQGLQVKQSEVHGMAKRGGIVFSHVRFGKEVWSPTIARGDADALIALEWAEGLRWLEHLKPGSGVFIADTRRIVPPFACRNRKTGAPMNYAQETPAEVVSRVADGYALDATGIAESFGDSRAANTVLLGVLSNSLDYPVADWLAVIEQLVPKKAREINVKAFEAGREWAEKAKADPSLRFDDAIVREKAFAAPQVEVKLEINPAWCKSCDICVKLCPERCLALNSEQIAYLKNPEACTGCHICEWLCPDFAISVSTISREAVTA